VQALFPATGETLTYAARSAPLRRVAFEVGDTVKDNEGTSFVVADVREEDKRLIYIDADGKELPESNLSDTLSVQRPEQRLLAGITDHPKVWGLRQSALRNQFEGRSREVRGLTGARISLIPHQLYIANEVAQRYAPRVLLADEVGLGKTIEACLILHRLHLSGRAKRILILVPDALVNQWFVELYRRFSLSFAIFDEERAVSIEEGADDPETANPFFDDQLVLCATSWIAENAKRGKQAAEGEWDLVIVDEAHHLEWTTESSSAEYDAVEAIAEKSAGLLLLTATPEQLGLEGHFARLRLLDPARFSDLDEFIAESEKYQNVSKLADALNSDDELTDDLKEMMTDLLGEEALEILENDDTRQQRAIWASALVDLHGPGRVLFRNRRLVLDNFPARIPHLYPLECDVETGFETKIGWLVDLIKSLPDSEKILLITKTQENVEKIEEALREKISATAAMFHEGLSLLQRDKNAAWFADDFDGARILLASEIGSEGRNFQFSHHLVLFDLPDDPGLLEQRIGRLDRIGQTSDIHVHVPFVEESSEELYALWYHRGLNAFEQTVHGAGAIFRQFSDRLKTLAEGSDEGRDAALPDLIKNTQKFKEEIDKQLDEGRDHLLEMSSFDRDLGEALVRQIEDLDEDERLEKLMLGLCDHFGVTVTDLDARTYLFSPDNLFSAESFPGLPDEGLSVTFDREMALTREDITFLSADHPMVISAMDSLVASDRGNAAFFRFEGAGEQLLMVEIVCVLECVAPERLHAERFLPPHPIRQIVDQKGRNRTADFSIERIRSGGRPGHSDWLRSKATALKATVPGLLDAAEKACADIADVVRHRAGNDMKDHLDTEIRRLDSLKEMNHPVRDSEIEAAHEEREELKKAIGDARLRVDSVRLILALK
ncbi:MAG: DEAD/DEAH box helicase family protein, partial [Verrucomicrobiales bacterium]|nr:DEAD/DEAH box helicase family protein [Verrucomicrobiales bacterium]